MFPARPVMTAAMVYAEGGEGLLHGGDVVVSQHDGVGGAGAGDLEEDGRPRVATLIRLLASSALTAVVAAGEFDDLGPSGEAAGQA